MSLYGTGYPLFYVSSSLQAHLSNGKIIQDEPQVQNESAMSQLTGERVISTPNYQYGMHWTFSVKYHLHKEGSYPGNLGSNFYTNYDLFGRVGILYAYNDGIPFLHGSPSLTISNATISTGVVTVTHESSDTLGYNSGIVANRYVWIRGVEGATELNGRHLVTEVVSATQFKVSLASMSAYSSGGEVDKIARFKLVDLHRLQEFENQPQYYAWIYVFESLDLVNPLKSDATYRDTDAGQYLVDRDDAPILGRDGKKIYKRPE